MNTKWEKNKIKNKLDKKIKIRTYKKSKKCWKRPNYIHKEEDVHHGYGTSNFQKDINMNRIK